MFTANVLSYCSNQASGRKFIGKRWFSNTTFTTKIIIDFEGRLSSHALHRHKVRCPDQCELSHSKVDTCAGSTLGRWKASHALETEALLAQLMHCTDREGERNSRLFWKMLALDSKHTRARNLPHQSLKTRNDPLEKSMQTESLGASAGKAGVGSGISPFRLPRMDSNTATLSANWMRTKVYDAPESPFQNSENLSCKCE